MVVEGAVGIAVGDDALGEDLADSGHQGKLRPIGLIDIDLELGELGLDVIDLDQPTAVGGLPGPMRANGEEGDRQKKSGDGLIAAAKEEDRPAGRFALGDVGHDAGYETRIDPIPFPNLNPTRNPNPLPFRYDCRSEVDCP